MDSHEIAWAAGLFDGEGTIFASETMKRARKNVRLHMAVRMTTFEDVARFHRAVGVGAVRGPYTRTESGKQRKPIWAWTAGTDESVRVCVALLWPYLGANKRTQASEAIATRDQHLSKPEPLTLRKDFCRRGHDQSVNRRIHPGGGSHCVLCQRLTYVLWRDRRKCKPAADAPLFAEIS